MKQVLKIEREKVTIAKSGVLVAEASDLGIGYNGVEWPSVVEIPSKSGSTSVLFRFIRTERDQEGDLVFAAYRSYVVPLGIDLQIFND